MTRVTRTAQAGVTLLELAIVVAILGLLLGATFAGLSVLEEAEFVEGLDRVDEAINGARFYKLARRGRWPGDDDRHKPWVNVLGVTVDPIDPTSAYQGDHDQFIELTANGEDALLDLVGARFVEGETVEFDTTNGWWTLSLPWADAARFESGLASAVGTGGAGTDAGWDWAPKGSPQEKVRNFLVITNVPPDIAQRIIDRRNGGAFDGGPIQVVDPATGNMTQPATLTTNVDIYYAFK